MREWFRYSRHGKRGVNLGGCVSKSLPPSTVCRRAGFVGSDESDEKGMCSGLPSNWSIDSGGRSGSPGHAFGGNGAKLGRNSSTSCARRQELASPMNALRTIRC